MYKFLNSSWRKKKVNEIYFKGNPCKEFTFNNYNFKYYSWMGNSNRFHFVYKQDDYSFNKASDLVLEGSCIGYYKATRQKPRHPSK